VSPGSVSRLDDLGGFLDGPLPDVSVGVSQRALGGVQARGHRRPALKASWSAIPGPCGQPEIMCTKS
jgi:hypothetical protein